MTDLPACVLCPRVVDGLLSYAVQLRPCGQGPDVHLCAICVESVQTVAAERGQAPGDILDVLMRLDPALLRRAFDAALTKLTVEATKIKFKNLPQ